MINDALEALKADPAVEAFNYTGDKVTSLIVDTENLYDGEQHIELSEVMYSFCMPDEIRTLGKQQAGDYSYITGTYAMIDLCDLTILERDTLELKMQTRDFLIYETAALGSDLDFLRNSMGSNPAFVPFYIEQLTITDVSREETIALLLRELRYYKDTSLQKQIPFKTLSLEGPLIEAQGSYTWNIDLEHDYLDVPEFFAINTMTNQK
jgi:hypothetical protein